MKHLVALFVVLALSVAATAVTHARSDGMKDVGMNCMDMKDMDMKGMDMDKKAQGTAHKAVGVVKNVDSAKGSVTLAHEPIKSLNWPAMTMGFTVKDKALFDKLAPYKKIEFEFVLQGKDYVITAVN